MAPKFSLTEGMGSASGAGTLRLQRPLAVRCGAFGDMVLFTALIRVLHAGFILPWTS